MILEQTIAEALQRTLQDLYQIEIPATRNLIQPTRKEFDGDFTIVVFPYVKAARKAPDMVAREIGDKICAEVGFITGYNVVKGYLNLSLSDDFWSQYLGELYNADTYGRFPVREEDPVLIEYSSPNTNKPLHLGHVRNNLLGHSVSQILMACGCPVSTSANRWWPGYATATGRHRNRPA